MSKQRYAFETLIPKLIPSEPKGLPSWGKALIIVMGIGYLSLALTLLIVSS